MLEVVIFDMDDTLYPEIDYVKSGFKYISNYLTKLFNKDSSIIYNDLIKLFNKSSLNVFNRIYDLYNIKYNDSDIEKLVNEYRNHKPDINLYDDVVPYINSLKDKGCKIGLITDGYKIAQRNKIEALCLENLIDNIIVTDELGREYWKPHHKSFEIMKSYFNTEYKNMTYIGDNIKKDFKAGNELGMNTIMIQRDSNIYKEIDVEDICKPKQYIKKFM